MLLFVAFIVLPFLWTAVSAFKPNDRIMADIAPFSLRTFVPKPFTLEAFVGVFTGGLGTAILMTLLVGAATVVCGILLNAMAGFSFAVFRFPGQGLLFVLVLISFLIPFESIAVPLYITVRRMGFTNTIFALIVPAIANGLCIFLFRQFFLGIPKDLVDAALIDGAGWFRIFTTIFLPLSRPAAITAGLLLFLSQWQAFFWPLIAIQSTILRMVQVAIAFLTQGENMVFWNYICAASFVVAAIPIILVFPLQKYYVKGMSTSGLKT